MRFKIGGAILSCLLAANLSGAELSVHAAASLTNALKEIGSVYEKQTGDKIQFNFGASSTLARQIDEGAAGDLFLSADEAKMNTLEQKGLLMPGTRRSLLSNLLVIIVPAEAQLVPKSAADLEKSDYKKIALAQPASVPAGIYAREYLQELGLWEPIKDKVVPTESVRAALAAVESGNVEAGFVYKTDAILSKKVKIALEISAAEGPKISYPVALLKSSKEPDRAKRFTEYLGGAEARDIFKKFGFTFVQ